MNIRKATIQDISDVEAIYTVRSVAEAALERGDLFVMEEDARIVGAALINQIQVDVYQDAPWEFCALPEEVCVLHTLVISPKVSGKGLGKQFVRLYED